jgi:hypothetical protein
VYKALHKTAVTAQANPVTTAVGNALSDRVNIVKYLCNIAVSAEVSNIILNTHFLTLILKLLKSSPNFAAATPVRAASNVLANATSMFNISRYWCATLLALLLRYATYIQPPPMKARDDHIIGSIAGLLSSSSKGNSLDNKLKKRLVAAFGEMVFYITAQEDDDGIATTGAEAEKWQLPALAIEVLGKCLRDDNDEVVKHYAAKTIENVLAQGGFTYRYRFITMDIASKLLEIAQNSLGEALQATGAMALSHLVFLVLSAHSSGPAVMSALKDINNNTKSIGFQGSGKRNSSPGAFIEPFAAPVILSTAKFIAKLFEKANFPGIVELLKDGQSKVQQAFLNIINVIFCAPIVSMDMIQTSTKDTACLEVRKAIIVDPTQGTFVKAAFTPIKSFFLRSHQALLPVLFRMMEQGSLTIIRSKAMLLSQLLCIHLPSILSTLAERRLPVLLIRVLEPALSAAENSRQPTGNLHLTKCALSLVLYWKSITQNYIDEVAEHLKEMAKLSFELLALDPNCGEAAGRTPGQDPDTTPGKKKSPGVSLPRSHLQPRSPNTKNENVSIPIEKLGFTSLQLKQTSELLRSIISLVAAQPALCRLVLGGNQAFLLPLANAIHALPIARSTMQSITTKMQSNDVKESILIAEQACLASLESLTQIDIPPFLPYPPSEHRWPWELDWCSFVDAGLQSLVPTLAQWLSHPEGDIRAVVASCLRRILPNFARSFCESMPHPSAADEYRLSPVVTCYQSVMSFFPLLLTDQAPVPQYITRLLVDTMAISEAMSIVTIQSILVSGATTVLVNLLRTSGSGHTEDGEELSLDPQLVVLIHGVFERSEGASALLQADLGGALSVAAIGTVYSNLPYPFHQIGHFNHDLLVSIVELLYHVLHHVLRETSSMENPSSASKGATRSPQRHGIAEQHRRLVMPLRAVSPALLMMMACVEHYLAFSPASLPPEADIEMDDRQHDRTIYAHLLELSSRCAGVLFDLFPDALSSQLLSKQSVALDTSQRDLVPGHSSPVLSPRVIVASVLKNKQVSTSNEA